MLKHTFTELLGTGYDGSLGEFQSCDENLLGGHKIFWDFQPKDAIETVWHEALYREHRMCMCRCLHCIIIGQVDHTDYLVSAS